MKTKIQNAIKDMMTKVKFDEKGHTYTRVSDGAWLQGVSTVSSIVPKNWLAAWGAKEAVKFMGFSDYPEDTKTAEEMLEKLKDISLKDYLKLLKEAKGSAFRKSKKALVDGTAGHKFLEGYVLSKIRGDKLPEIPKEGNLERPIKQFIKWEKENIKDWVASEARVAHPDRGFAGTLDSIAILKNNDLAIIDFKFASNVSPDYYLQAAGYASCFESYGIRFQERIILRLPKTLEKDEWNPKTHKYSKVENTLEDHRVPTKYDEDRDVFYGCLPLKAWINKLEK